MEGQLLHRVFVVEVDDGPVVVLVFEKRLIRPDHLGVLLESRPDPFA